VLKRTDLEDKEEEISKQYEIITVDKFLVFKISFSYGIPKR